MGLLRLPITWSDWGVWDSAPLEGVLQAQYTPSSTNILAAIELNMPIPHEADEHLERMKENKSAIAPWELCSRAISGTFEQVLFCQKWQQMDVPILAITNIGNYQYWQLPILARNELAKNGNLCERPDLKIAKSGHSHKSLFMAISRNCQIWKVWKLPLLVGEGAT